MSDRFYEVAILPTKINWATSDEIGHQPHHPCNYTFLLLNTFLNIASPIPSVFHGPTPLFNQQAINRAQKLPVNGLLLGPSFVYPIVSAKAGDYTKLPYWATCSLLKLPVRFLTVDNRYRFL